jgi:hypothetical protein
MSRISAQMLAVAGVIAFALPASAGPRGGGGGGGAFHGGGGGGVFHGGGGGVFHGGGAPSFSRGPAIGGGMGALSHPGFSARSLGPAFHAGLPRSFSAAPFHGARSITGRGVGPRGLTYHAAHAGHGVYATRGIQAAHGIHGARGIHNVGGALASRSLHRAGVAGTVGLAGGAALAHGARWQHGERWQHRADWWHRRPFFGWAGPVFWPYFYDDFYYNVFWDYGPDYYYDPFWAYGYGDIYGALFSPYDYDELSGWTRPPRARSGVARANAATQGQQPPQWSAMCGDDTQVATLPIERITAAVSPDEQQRAALDALASASAQAAQTIKAACPADIAFTPTGRLDAMERRVHAMVQAVALIRPPLDSFYGMLSDEQKSRFNAVGLDKNRSTLRSQTATCGPNAAAIPTWPQARIDQAVRPRADQRALMDKLKDAGAQAAEMLDAACPAEPPATPPARLAAVAARLDALLRAVRLVHVALNDFYGSLSDEQKAQFNGIRPVVQNGQPKS